MPENTIPKEVAYQIIHDELQLDGNPRLNLASFVTTWMEPECDKLMIESLNKNYVDMDEYPVTTEIQNRCVNMIANLYNAPSADTNQAIGVGAVGSSEAIMLAGLAFKKKWQKKRKQRAKHLTSPILLLVPMFRWDTPIHVDAASGGFVAPFLYVVAAASLGKAYKGPCTGDSLCIFCCYFKHHWLLQVNHFMHH